MTPPKEIDNYMTLNDTLKGLKYIADSPPYSHGGFHPQAVQIAKMAIFHINNLKDNLGTK
jgi:hypothetical protein